METQLREDERLLRQGAANMWRGVEAVGGRLYLTSLRMVFESHCLTVQTGVTVIELSQISAAGPHNALLLIPNGIAVRRSDGSTETFVVWRRGLWLSAIATALSEHASAGRPAAATPSESSDAP